MCCSRRTGLLSTTVSARPVRPRVDSGVLLLPPAAVLHSTPAWTKLLLPTMLSSFSPPPMLRLDDSAASLAIGPSDRARTRCASAPAVCCPQASAKALLELKVEGVDEATNVLCLLRLVGATILFMRLRADIFNEEALKLWLILLESKVVSCCEIYKT